jgi:predicted dehydrogenase
MKLLNVAVVSAGGAGRAHAIRFFKTPNVSVRAVYDPNRKNLKDLSWIEKNGGRVTTEYENILDDDKIDVISICSPDHAHFDHIIAALKAGKHVLVEKPMVTSLEQCRKLQEAVSKSDRIFGVHHQMRYVPCFVRARDYITNGKVGLPFIVEADYIHDMRERASLFDDWRIDPKNPQNIVLGASCHTIDLLKWILNDEVVEVFSFAAHIAWPEYPDKDTVMTVLKFSKGAIGKTLVTIACQRPQLNSLVIYGSDGSIINNLWADRHGFKRYIHLPDSIPWKQKVLSRLLTLTRAAQDFPFSVYEHDTASQALIKDFLSCIQENKQFSSNFSESAYTVQICLASIQSYQEGRPVQVKRMF